MVWQVSGEPKKIRYVQENLTFIIGQLDSVMLIKLAIATRNVLKVALYSK